MIHIIITSYKEPKATLKAVETFLSQKLPKNSKITVIDPFQEDFDFLKKHIKSKNVEFFLDPGEGKAYALNLFLQEHSTGNKNDIFVFTDGDVYVSNNAIQGILKAFENKEIGCVTARPVSLDSKNTKYGFWSHVLFNGIDRVRRKLSREKKFFECSGYLFAIRQGVIYDFPHKTSEDSIIPYLFWKKGYRIAYLPNVEVYVKNPANWQDWIAQKVRNIQAHENLPKIAPDMPRTKSFFNEVYFGSLFALKQAKNLQEFYWLIQLYLARLYIYLYSFYLLKIKKSQKYKDGWRETEIKSTRIFD